jgi:acyl-CoA thioester hydrolase
VSRAFEPPPGREVFELPLAVTPEDIDENGHVNNVVYVRWIQEAGTAHWRSKFREEETRGSSWVVLRHEIGYRRGLRLGDQPRARTWVGEPRGARFDRYVVIEGPQGAAVQARSDWAMVDAATMRPVRIPAEVVARFLPGR